MPAPPVTLCASAGNKEATLRVLKAAHKETDRSDLAFRTDRFYVSSTFGGRIPCIEEIHEFLEATELYDYKRKTWLEIPADMDIEIKEPQLTEYIQRIVEDVVRFFGYSERRVTRARAGPATVRGRVGDVSETYRLSPELLVAGTERTFRPGLVVPDDSEVLAYDLAAVQSAASFIAVREDEEDVVLNDEKLHLELFALVRDIFYYQSSRTHVHTLVMTQHNAFFYRLDRGGILKCPKIDIHKNATDFVRCLLLLCSPDPIILGVDPNVFWVNDSRYIKSMNAQGESVDYKLNNPDPIWRLDESLIARGTAIWDATCPETGERVIIKDSSRIEDTERDDLPLPEYETLKAAQGLDGVVQMSRNFYRFECNWVRSRIVMKAYGRATQYIETRMQLLRGFRDAVAGHRNLWDKGVIHMDVSCLNVLMGSKDAPVGQRGVLIDLDGSKTIGEDGLLPETHTCRGTKIFTSLRILDGPHHHADNLYRHTHLDELESFAYVLCCLYFTVFGHRKYAAYPEIVTEWDSAVDEIAATAKRRFWDSPKLILDSYRNPFFGRIFRDLILDISKVLADGALALEEVLMEHDGSHTYIKKEWLDETSKQDYEEFLAAVDRALLAVEKEEQRVRKTARKTRKEGAKEISKATRESAVPHAADNNESDSRSLAPININALAPSTPERRKRGANDLAEKEENEDDMLKKKLQLENAEQWGHPAEG
ncbi:hypothetical protein NLJ89_g10190 [Agrocybe chaxingu]|uniref:Fungal-type protein kinase domain-containing protein n=1 Tax=Agrocybe chaxingu TaxID=84603 RepID=A0A9W8MSV4_9AGAR|nr:hypothetical protein NLJ89_g10190 [Agrocybe chaxingu]